ncbi:MAG: ATP-binding cassette, subfamily bacterial [Actinomycetota bacterium]|nr:ATP-binding cassette, subfamily bacterial [Actinomycetota bacterium]
MRRAKRAASTSHVAGRIARNDTFASVNALVQWIGFHFAPIPIGLALKSALDHLARGQATPMWTALAVIAGFEVARWVLLVSAAVQWHGTYLGWMTVPRVNALTSLATGGGAVAGRLPSSPGEAVSRFRDDAQDIASLLDAWLDVAGAVAAAIVGVAIMASIDPIAGVAVAVPVALALIASWWLGPVLRAWRRSAREATARVTGFIGDTFGGVLAIKAGAAEDAVHERFREINVARARVSRRDQLGGELVRSLGYGTGEVTIGIVLLLVASSYHRGALSVGDIGLFASYVTVIAGVPKWVARASAYQRQADVSVDRIAELLRDGDRRSIAAPVITHLRHGPPPFVNVDDVLEDPFEELRVEGLVVRHPGSGRGLDGVDLVVQRGELVVVTGRVGAGKSTLLRALLGLVEHDAGTIRWNGALVDDPATILVPPRVAYLPQVPRLFSEALADTVLLGLPADGLAHAIWLTCLDEDLARMPDGLGTLIGPRGLRLSGGQIQRTGAARALVRRPELLVIDDLSSALDVETEARLWQRLSAGGFTSAIIVSHRPQLLERADRVIRLDDGRLS